MRDLSIGFLGAGQMARALAAGFVAARVAPADRIVACDPADSARQQFADACPGARLVSELAAVLKTADILILAIKPQVFPRVAADLGDGLRGETLVVSVMAGVSLARLTDGLGSGRVIRVMPNTPCLVGCGASAYACGPDATSDDADGVQQLLQSVGIAFAVEESQLDAVTGLSGSGPAFVYQIIEALADGGVRMGLPRSMATALAAQTVAGAARMVLETGTHPGELKDRVASPGGTTIAGIQRMEDRGVRGAMMAAVEAAAKRSAELST
jgi:pyrroline-5-carboxylate reductase